MLMQRLMQLGSMASLSSSCLLFLAGPSLGWAAEPNATSVRPSHQPVVLGPVEPNPALLRAAAEAAEPAAAVDLEPTPSRTPSADVTQAWPGNSDGLVFAWKYGIATQLEAWGNAHINEQGLLDVSDGAMIVQGVNDQLTSACQATNELTIEVVLRTNDLEQTGPKRIITFSSDFASRNFMLGQRGDELVLRLRTPATGENGTNPEMTLTRLPANRLVHLVVTYYPGRLVCYRDGVNVLDTDRVQGDFSNWTEQYLLLGNEWARERDWSGSLERIAIYSRSLGAAEANSHYRASVAR